MVSSPPSTSKSKYLPLGSKAQDRLYQKIEKHLNPFDETIADKIDPDLTKHDDQFIFTGLIPVGLEHHVPRHIGDRFNLAIQHKENSDLHPYGVVEKHIPNKKKAKEFVENNIQKLRPLIEVLEDRVSQQPNRQIDSFGVFEIPILTEPKVVTVIKTNRVDDAIRLFHKAEDYQPVKPNKPSLLKKIALALNLSKRQEVVPLLNDEELPH